MQNVAPDSTPAYVTLLEQGHYDELIQCCEQAIEADPTTVSHYWYLGLAQLLQGQEEAAQIAWMAPLMEADPNQAEQWTQELRYILSTEAQRQAAQSANETAWLLRQHLREFVPDDLDNLLQLLALDLKTGQFTYHNGLLQHLTQTLQETEQVVSLERLLQVAQQILAFNPEHVAVFDFLEACAPRFAAAQQLSEWVRFLLAEANQFHHTSRYTPAIHLAKLCARLAPEDSNVLLQAVSLMQSDAASMLESIPLTEQLLTTATDFADRVLATHFMLSSLMLTCGSWQKTCNYYQMHQSLLASADSAEAGQSALYRLLAMGMFSHYFADHPAIDRPIRNRVAQVSQAHFRSVMTAQTQRYQKRQTPTSASSQSRPIKIGYLSDCLRLHSVGWLVRWLLKYHDRNQFEVHLYSTRRSNDPLQQAFIREYGDRFHHLSHVPAEIADQIDQDEIDILVELDSLTSFTNCAVAALKPAPIQVSWLGFDASGIPAIDYFMADPYVLPDDAQTYYSEKIWRLPQTYIAVDGFEVDVPNLRRDQLAIPNNAVVYLSSQSGLKRNPDNVRLQLRILKEVPNSYFLIKSFNAKPEFLKAFFYELAEAEGVDVDRLRFLPDVASNAVYRANLTLADVILDTYPYNGATTTLEALWMGLPIVTRVGEQFAARNSYTMMMNAGVQEGIAWNDDEYLEWGVRLGTDTNLRRKIFYQLHRSRQTAPLWNARQFTNEMEQAYQQMYKQMPYHPS